MKRLEALCRLFEVDRGETLDKTIRALATGDDQAALDIFSGDPKARGLALVYLRALRDEWGTRAVAT